MRRLWENFKGDTMKFCNECSRYFESRAVNEIDVVCSDGCRKSRRKILRTEEDLKIDFEVRIFFEKIYEKVLIEMGVRR